MNTPAGMLPEASSLHDTPCTCHMLRRTSRRLSQFYDQALKPVGLKLTQYSVLAYTHYASSLTITGLADLMDVDRTTLTRNLRPLIQAGLVRVGEGTDKRCRAVQLTDAGHRLFKQARPLWQQAEHDFRHNIGKKDATALRQLLDIAAVAAEA